MPRRQRFKPSRKPKPAIEPSEQDVVIPVDSKHLDDMSAGQRAEQFQAERHPDDVDAR